MNSNQEEEKVLLITTRGKINLYKRNPFLPQISYRYDFNATAE